MNLLPIRVRQHSDINAIFQNGKSSISMVNLAFSSMALIEEKKKKLISAGTSNEHVNMTIPTRCGLIRILKEAAIFHQF